MRYLLTTVVLLLLLSGCGGQPTPTTVTRPASLDTATTRLTDEGHFRVSYTSELDPPQINKFHTWTLHLETPAGAPATGARITVDGGMPEHNHGLPAQPKVTAELGNGDYRVEGMKFQMPGWWTVTVTIAASEQEDAATFNLVLP